jgi:hypothetical protein
MSANWYYYHDNNRVGPVGEKMLSELLNNGTLNTDTYVWTKGFTEWKRAKDVEILSNDLADVKLQNNDQNELSWKNINSNDVIWYINIGLDRGVPSMIYGPYQFSDLQEFFKLQRINLLTMVWCPGQYKWSFVGEIPNYQKLFHTKDDFKTPQIEEKDLIPTIVKIHFQDSQKIFEGLARDITSSSLQLLIANFPPLLGHEINLELRMSASNSPISVTGLVSRMLPGGQGVFMKLKNVHDDVRLILDK